VAGTKGERTRSRILEAAFELFSTRGFEATTLRDVAERVGVNKAALYYYFANKSAILAALFTARADETTELLAWARSQPAGPELARRTVLRWIDGSSAEKLRGIRFMNANPSLARPGGDAIGAGLEALVDLVAADRQGADRLAVRMAFLSLNAAVAADQGFSDAEIIDAARHAAIAILGPA
jgi:AcrR family transcriptional regulator